MKVNRLGHRAYGGPHLALFGKKVIVGVDEEKRCAALRTRAALVDLMLSGQIGAEDVAIALGISRRTLQRRLRQKQTTYQAELDAIRRDIAIRSPST